MWEEGVVVGIGMTFVSALITANLLDYLNSVIIMPVVFCREVLYPLKREASFVNSLPLDVIATVVGWIYTIFWIICYYPQV